MSGSDVRATWSCIRAVLLPAYASRLDSFIEKLPSVDTHRLNNLLTNKQPASFLPTAPIPLETLGLRKEKIGSRTFCQQAQGRLLIFPKAKLVNVKVILEGGAEDRLETIIVILGHSHALEARARLFKSVSTSAASFCSRSICLLCLPLREIPRPLRVSHLVQDLLTSLYDLVAFQRLPFPRRTAAHRE